MINLYAQLDDYVFGDRTYLSSAFTSGKIVNVDNAAGYAVNDFVIIGRIGDEQSELAQIDSISSNAITMKANLGFAHDEDTEMVSIAFNKRKLYRSSTKTGTYTYINVLATIRVDYVEGTKLTDNNGNNSYWYKATYYNSTSLLESNIDDAIAVSGGDTSNYVSIYDVRREAGFRDTFSVKDVDIDDYREKAQNYVLSKIGQIYALPLSECPQILKLIIQLYSAGLLLLQEYGAVAEGTNKNGQEKLDRADKIINDILARKIKLFDSNNTELALNADYAVLAEEAFDADSQTGDREMFNLSDETIRMTDTDDPTDKNRTSGDADLF